MKRLVVKGRIALRAFAVVAALAAVQWSCSSDGGVGGTGISTLRGNVVASGEVVVRELSTLTEVTTTDGYFELQGEFDGDVTLEFRAESGAEPAVLTLAVGAGADVTLENVTLQAGEAVPERVFVERLTLTLAGPVQCAGGGGRLDAVDARGRTFVVLLDEGTQIGRNASAFSCEDLREGFVIKVRGTLQGEEILADRVEVVRTHSA